MADVKVLAEQLVNLTVKEVNELAGILKDEYGIEPAAAAVAVAVGGGAGAGEAAEEKTAFENTSGQRDKRCACPCRHRRNSARKICSRRPASDRSMG